MANPHRTNVLVTSCLKTPVDPHTKAPLASYERGRVLPYSATALWDNRDYDKEVGSVANAHAIGDLFGHGAAGDCLDLSKIFFSNEEYYSKLEELKKAHLRTMAELESMYQQKLQLKSTEPLDVAALELGHRWVASAQTVGLVGVSSCFQIADLAQTSAYSSLLYSSDENEAGGNVVEKGLLFSPKECIKNMWKDFKVSPSAHRMSSSSLHSMPGEQRRPRKRRERRKQEDWKPKGTVPKPFHMMLREAEKQKHGVKTRSEVELENAELRRQLEELTECQKQFRASPVPAHVHLPVYEELQEQRRSARGREAQRHRTAQKPFSFLERERLKKEQRQQQQQQQQSDQEKVKPFKAKPVPKSVYVAASGEQMKEEQLYRSIKIQMRAEEMLRSASVPPSIPQINKDVPDFGASYRRFQKQLEKRKEVKPTTACEPFDLRTSQIPSHRERILADIEKDQGSPRMLRWPHINPGAARTPNSSLCSSLSGSLELLPAKVTDATKRRHEAVRKALEQRKKAEEEEERWREKQREREKKLQRMVLKRAEANDPHLIKMSLGRRVFILHRKQDLQRKKEYRQEIREMRERVKGRPLLLEQVTQVNGGSLKH
uniref:Protein FAM161A n=1 Tax=Fundulus heteroclitus TaxID=8078 RepID=A0A3Q2TYW7_FUNHE